VAGTIALVYVNGYVPSWSADLVADVSSAFAAPVIPGEVTLDLAQAFAPERRQSHATLLLAALIRQRPDNASMIVGLTAVDLFIPVLTFVFGQAQLGGPGAVVSTYRLRNTFYGLPADDRLLRERARKEAVHELGHVHGLVHCPDYRCVMAASTNIGEVDLKGPTFCTVCADALRAGRARPLGTAGAAAPPASARTPWDGVP